MRTALIGCLMLVHSLVHGAAIDRPWFQYRSANFTVISDLPEAQVAQSVDDLELFRSVLLKVTNAKSGQHSIPVHMYLFSSVGDFQQTIRSPEVLGYMSTSLRQHTMAARSGVIGLEAQHIMFHEYVHYLLRNGGVSGLPPKWYDEGLAEVLSATQLRPDHVVLGGDIPNRIHDLSFGSLLPMEEMIRASDFGKWKPLNIAVFYAKAYALVNYLHLARMAGGADRLPQLQTYLQLVNNNVDPTIAFKQAFGVTFVEMERELGRFLSRSPRPVLNLPRAMFAHDGTYKKEPVPTAALAYQLGYLTVERNPVAARTLFKFEHKDQTDGRFRAGVAVSYQIEKSFDAGTTEARAALTLAPQDTTVLQEVADLFSVWCRTDKPPPTCPVLRAEAKLLYERLLQIEPDRLEAHAAYGTLLVDTGAATEAIPHLTLVLAQAPWEINNIAQLGYARLQTGDKAAALPLLRRALRWIEDNSTMAARLRTAISDAETGADAVENAAGKLTDKVDPDNRAAGVQQH